MRRAVSRRAFVPSRVALVVLGAALLAAACIQRRPTHAGASNAAQAPSSGSEAAAGVVPEGGVSVLDTQGPDAFKLSGATDKVALRVIDVAGQPFDKALEATIKEPGQSAWEVQMASATSAAVARDDVLLATFYVRVEKEQESGGGQTEFVFELAGEPYTKSVSYAVPLTPEWRKVNVRFRALDNYEPGRANMIFRLGYTPETIQVGGISVQNFAQRVVLSRLPTTQALDRRLAARPTVIASRLDPVDAGELAFQIDPGEVIRKISPYVYGLNSQTLGDTGASVRRNGGNRGSAYNWEGNYSNAGEDYQHQNDDWPCSVMAIPNCNEPAAQFLGFFERNKAAGAETIATVPMLDYVAADKNGPVKAEDKAPSARFVSSKPAKGKPFAETPDLKDGVVYEDELVHYLVKRLGKGSQGGIKFYSLDNEPALWPSTHPRIHPEHTTYEEIVRRTEATAAAIKAVDPSAFLLSGVMFGWAEYQSLSSAPDAAKYNAEFGTYTDYFLDAMKQLEKKHHQRLADALDIHWYPEARGSERITEEDASRASIDERLQAPRSLWDPTYTEKSWIAQQTGKPIRLIPWFREIIEKRYPGTQLAMTEYNYGATTHISGGLAQVDVLGVLGREGVYLATYWGKGAGVGQLPPYIAAAFRLYRNYDGKGGKFGEAAVRASVKDDASASIFAATGPGDRLTVVVINKQQQNRYTGVFDIAGGARYRRAETYVIDQNGTGVKQGKPALLEGGKLRYGLEPLSATLFIFQKK
jgi:Glycoside hydrolase family 44